MDDMTKAKQLNQLFHYMGRANIAMANAPVSPGEFIVLEALINNPKGIRVSDFCEKLKVAPPSVTHILNALEKKGFIERSLSKEDRRVLIITITENGQMKCEKAFNVMFERVNGLCKYLGEDFETFINLFGKVSSYFENELKGDNNV